MIAKFPFCFWMLIFSFLKTGTKDDGRLALIVGS